VDVEAGRRVHLVPALGAREGIPVDLAPLFREVDVVHVHTVVNPEALVAAAAFGRAVLTVQDHRYFGPGRGKWTLRGEACTDAMSPLTCAPCFEDVGYGSAIVSLTAARLAAVARYPAVTVLSRYMRDELVAAGLEHNRLHVIPPLVPPLPAAAPDGPPCVAFVGRLTAAKGVRDAVLAWRSSGISLPLVTAGTGPLRAFCEEQGATVMGWQPPAGVAALLGRSEALLMPSRWQEPYGIAGVEALRAGVPVVAYRSGGIPEWHPGGDLLVPWGNVPALAHALRLACGRRAEALPGLEPAELLDALDAVYAALP
jgi:glycosyltransferase involved in cell wall biosynthesis